MAPIDDSDSGMESQEGSQSLDQDETLPKSSKDKKYAEIEDDIEDEVNIFLIVINILYVGTLKP